MRDGGAAVGPLGNAPRLVGQEDKRLFVCSLCGIYSHSSCAIVFHVWNGHSSIHYNRSSACSGGLIGYSYRIAVGQSIASTGIERDRLCNSFDHRIEFHYPTSHSNVPMTLTMLKGKKEKLCDDYPETLETINNFGDTHPIKESVNRPIDLYEAWNKPEKAKE